MRILLVEDNPKLSSLLLKLLTEHGYAADLAGTVEEARESLAMTGYDLVILDLTLPDGDGHSVLRMLRAAGQDMPVLVATARGDVTERVRTLDKGADDYLVKPFSPEELLARVRALLRRPHQALQPVLTAGNLALDPAQGTVCVDGVPMEIPRREMAMLEVLMRRYGTVVSRTALEETSTTFGAEVTPNAIEAAISRLRRRLEQHQATVAVATMRGLGYILAERGGRASASP